jgi:hypothetical protein
LSQLSSAGRPISRKRYVGKRAKESHPSHNYDAIVDHVQTMLGYILMDLNILIEAPNAPGPGMRMTVLRLVILGGKNLAAGIGVAAVRLLHC